MKTVDDLRTIAEQSVTSGEPFMDKFCEKLAELIVRECGKSCTLQADEDEMFRKFGIEKL